MLARFDAVIQYQFSIAEVGGGRVSDDAEAVSAAGVSMSVAGQRAGGADLHG